jgi:hypothetical protein
MACAADCSNTAFTVGPWDNWTGAFAGSLFRIIVLYMALRADSADRGHARSIFGIRIGNAAAQESGLLNWSAIDCDCHLIAINHGPIREDDLDVQRNCGSGQYTWRYLGVDPGQPNRALSKPGKNGIDFDASHHNTNSVVQHYR